MSTSSLLAQARSRKGWTLDQAAKAVGTSAVTFSRWEKGNQKPYGYNLEKLCSVFHLSSEALGLGEDHTNFLTLSPSHPVNGDLTLDLLAVAFVPQSHFDGVQRRITTILEEYDAMSMFDVPEEMNRRDALVRLACLPFIASLGPGISNARAEDVITQCAASIAACWELSKSSYEGDLHKSFGTASQFIPTLISIAENSSRYRKEALLLVAQCNLLKTVLGWHLQGVREASVYAQDAIKYAQEVNEYSLQITAMDYLCWALYYDHRSKQAEKTAMSALALIHQYESQLPPLLCSGVYSTCAVMQARNGEKASKTFDLAGQFFVTSLRREPLKYIYMDYTQSALFLNEGMIEYFAGEQPKAMSAFVQIIDPEQLTTKVQIPGRSKVETLNFMALSSLKKKEKDREETLHYWEAAIRGAVALQSEQRFNEAVAIYDMMDIIWPKDPRINEMRELVNHW